MVLRTREEPLEAHRVQEQRRRERAVLPILELQRSYGNQAVARMLAATRPVLQREIRILPADYMAGLNKTAVTLTPAQLTAYINFALKDEMASLWASAVNEQTNWTTLAGTINDANQPMPTRVDALTRLVTSVNTVAAAQQNREPAHKTRYATDPAKGYRHTGTSPRWGKDEKMWELFGPAFGALGALPSTRSADAVSEDRKKKDKRDADAIARPVSQLSWAQATTLFPKPLLNLLFDVRFQLDTGGRVIIDERGADARAHKRTTESEPGTMRAYHQDSKGILPPNTYEKTPEENPHQRKQREKAGGAAPRGDNVPASAQALHDHYERTSTSGAGSAIQAGRNTPEGFAEYTGTGTDTEHNTKVVLDYMQKRVYVTLSHYQYWALIDRGGRHEFWKSNSQEIALASGELETYLGKERLAPANATLMSPWVEVLAP